MESMECLLQPPNSHASVEFVSQYKRVNSTYENLSQKFIVPKQRERRYGIQYSNLYYTRLSKMRSTLVQSAIAKWGNDYKIKELRDLKVGEICIIIGTLFKKMSLRPNILKEFSDKHKLPPQPSRGKYGSINDELVLEDTVQRVVLCGNISANELTTGVVVALLGSESDNGRFIVDEMCFAGIPIMSTAPTLMDKDKYVLLVSGLNIGSSWCDNTSVQMLIDYICGQIGGYQDNELCSLITRVIVTGNSVTDKPLQSNINKENKVRFSSRNYSAQTVDAMIELDQFLSQLTSSVSCDLMPGSHDPSNYRLPHQPLHKCMLPDSSKWSGLNCVTNPYHCNIDNISFLGSSGENINDIIRCTDNANAIEVLLSTLEWNHMVPTAPDTLGCYPYDKTDPFIISDCPQVYFVGNQKRYQSKLINDGSGQHSVLLLCIPSFDITHSAVLVNTKSFESEEICFNSTLTIQTNPEQDDATNNNDIDIMQQIDSDDD